MEFPEYLRSLRKEARLSQRELAERIIVNSSPRRNDEDDSRLPDHRRPPLRFYYSERVWREERQSIAAVSDH